MEDGEIPIEFERRRPITRFKKFLRLFTIVAIAVALIIVVLVSTTLQSIGPGEVAVIYDPITRSVSEQPIIGPAFFFKLPWQGVIRDFYTIDYIELSTAPNADYPAIKALTNDGVEISVEMTFTYSINPNLFPDLAKHYPRIDYEEQRLKPLLEQIVKDVISKYSVEEVITERDRIAREIEDVFRNAVKEDPTLKAIQLHQVNLKSIILPETIELAIQEKVAAYQRKIAAQYEAERIVTLARANATSIVINAEAHKNATILKAEGTREALILVLNATGDPYVARLWMLQNIEDANIIIIMTGNETSSLPIILQPR
ncbi:MAG: prohibitin family protein [Thermoprotei archaeon]|nr:MAG: prohibitin family protein [Thermoprotei archaeon]